MTGFRLLLSDPSVAVVFPGIRRIVIRGRIGGISQCKAILQSIRVRNYSKEIPRGSVVHGIRIESFSYRA